MTWILAFGVVVFGIVAWNMFAVASNGELILNHRERRRVKRFYARKKNRGKMMVMEEQIGESRSPKEYGIQVAGKRKRKQK